MQASRVIRRFLLPALALAAAAAVVLLSPGAERAEAQGNDCTVASSSGKYLAKDAEMTDWTVADRWASPVSPSDSGGAHYSTTDSAIFERVTYIRASTGANDPGPGLPPTLAFCVQAPTTGVYSLTAAVRSNAADTSLFVEVDDARAFIFDVGGPHSARTMNVSARVLGDRSFMFDLNANEPTPVTIYARSGDVSIRNIKLTGPSNYRPADRIVDLWPQDDLTGAVNKVAGAGKEGTTFRLHDLNKSGQDLRNYTNIINLEPLDGQRFVGAQNEGDARPTLTGGRASVAAFTGSGDGVEIRNLELANYWPGRMFGAIAPKSINDVPANLAYDWHIEGNYVHDNRGVGVRLASGMTVTNNIIERNHQIGITTHSRNAGDEAARDDLDSTWDIDAPYTGGRLSGVSITNNVIRHNGLASHCRKIREDEARRLAAQSPNLKWLPIADIECAKDSRALSINGYPQAELPGMPFNHHDGGIKLAWIGARGEQPILIENNEIYENFGVGIFCDVFCENVAISKNRIYNNGTRSEDRFGGEIFLEISRSIVVQNNIVCGVGRLKSRVDYFALPGAEDAETPKYKYAGAMKLAEVQDVTVRDNTFAIVDFTTQLQSSGENPDSDGSLLIFRNATSEAMGVLGTPKDDFSTPLPGSTTYERASSIADRNTVRTTDDALFRAYHPLAGNTIQNNSFRSAVAGFADNFGNDWNSSDHQFPTPLSRCDIPPWLLPENRDTNMPIQRSRIGIETPKRDGDALKDARLQVGAIKFVENSYCGGEAQIQFRWVKDSANYVKSLDWSRIPLPAPPERPEGEPEPMVDVWRQVDTSGTYGEC